MPGAGIAADWRSAGGTARADCKKVCLDHCRRSDLTSWYNVALIGALLFLALRAAAVQPDYPVTLDFSQPTPARAAAAWAPMAGSIQPRADRDSGLQYLRFSCNLVDKDNERASWDHPFELDLSLTRGIRFMFRCPDATPIASFFCYFKSGNGWYVVPFRPQSSGKWEMVEILKAASTIEGTPAGWSRIEALRISAWRGSFQNTHFDLAALGIIHPTIPAAIIRSVSSIPRLSQGDARGIFRYAANVAKDLDQYGLHAAVLDDMDLNQTRLERLKLVILPYNPHLSADRVALLERYVRAGGRIVGFYELPAALGAALEIEPGSYVSARQFSAGLSAFTAGSAKPAGFPPVIRQNSWNIFSIQPRGNSKVWAWWHDGQNRRTEFPAVVASAKGAWMSHVYLAQDRKAGERLVVALIAPYLDGIWDMASAQALRQVTADLPYPDFNTAATAVAAAGRRVESVQRELKSAISSFNAGVDLLQSKNPVSALVQAEHAKRHLEQAYLILQQPVPQQFRGLWVHRGYGIDNWSWDKTARAAAESGFNALLVNMLTAGSSYYPSRLLTENTSSRQKTDQLAQALQACQRHGLALHIWKVCYAVREDADREVMERMRREGRLQQNFSGSQEPWLCPSDPRNQLHEVDTVVEILNKYPVAGIHLDYIRYPDASSCFCSQCRKRFEKFSGRNLSDWPQVVRSDAKLNQQWNDFRRDNVTTLVKLIHEAIAAHKSSVQLSAAVFGNWLSARESVAQDWVEWCRKGYLDFVCPMNYTNSRTEFMTLLQRQLSQLRGTGVQLYPGIGLSSEQLNAVATMQQITAAGTLGVDAFVIFELNHTTAVDILPALAEALRR